ncbi:5'-nucleotidase domain-containing protein [Natrialba hulunbeirensis JCM 10989]|uniref:5'-nucleotidase domain-containing protein n=2 Tax=Natrialba hulunbeirensis TaxID=123783 RepID=L9ZYX4_9EURY|nr:5'-nucleotidase domain-containing protein [Natrialba hulunbeirensis JCM 10989]
MRENDSTQDDHAGSTASRRRFLGTTAGISAGALLPAAATGAAETGADVGTAADADDTVTLVHDTHFHGRFFDAEEDDLNLARYYTVVEDVLADHENSLFVGNGDDLAPSMLGLEYEGEHMIEAMNEMDIDVVGVGNHEYDFGAEVATERFEESEFPWVVANLLDENGDAVPGTERWKTFEAGDLTVGIFGLVSRNFHSLTDYPQEWQVLDYVEGSQEAVDALREEGADVVVLASHVSTGIHYTLAEAVEGLDAIVGSHSGVVFDEPELVGDTVISEFGDEFDHVGAITLDADGTLVDWERTDLLLPEWEPEPAVEEYDEISVRYTDEVEEDETIADIAESWSAELEAELGQTAFESEVELDATFDNYAVETNWGNLMTDTMRSVGEIGDIEVDIAAQNAGGIRGDSTHGPGEIPGTAVMDILPFPNEIEVVEVTGEQVRDYLESEVRSHPADQFGAQPAIQVSGVSYEWSGHADEVWVDNVFVGGEPIDEDATYYLAHNDYSIGNSDILSAGEIVLESGQFQGPYILDQLEEKDTVAPERENRMLRVDEEVDEATVAHDGGTVTLTIDVPPGAAEIAEESFRAVIRTGDDLPATDASSDGETVDVTFDADELTALAEQVDDPVVRLFGEYEPDQDAWDYEFEVPTSDGYDRFKLKADVSADAVLGEESDGDGAADEGADADEDEDADAGEDDGDADANADDDETDGGDDGLPGFGPLAALGGGAAGTYLYARHHSGDDTGSGRVGDDGPDA